MEENEITDRLNEIPEPSSRPNPFKIPEGYFEKLPSEIMKSIEAEQTKSKVFHIREFFIKSSWAVAASVVLLIGISIIYWYNAGQNSQQFTYNDITPEEIIDSEVLQTDSYTDVYIEESAANAVSDDEVLISDYYTSTANESEIEAIIDYLKSEELDDDELEILLTGIE